METRITMKPKYKWISILLYGRTQYFLVNSKEFDSRANRIHALAKMLRTTDELELIERIFPLEYFARRYKRPVDRILIPKVLRAVTSPEFSNYKQILLESISDRKCDIYKAELL